MGIVVLVLAAGGVTGWALQRPRDEVSAAPATASTGSAVPPVPSSAASSAAGLDPVPSATAPVESPQASAPVESPRASATPSAPTGPQLEAQAKRRLDELAEQGRAGVELDSRWIAQVASKWIGIKDPLQRTASGSSVFKAADILAEYQRFERGDNAGASIFMLRNTDFGKGARQDGRIIYFTFADRGFGSREEALGWCRDRFPGLSGKRLENTCLPTRLKPLRG